MKHVVIGTAGHIDHGKTTLVKRLTGVDTDRLEEEKRRGMTIELGFAPLTLPSGNIVSIVDVPGHEKFVKTMVAGVTGIDFVLLVVAADEGVMPQTKEHIEILSLLDIHKGVVALTKTDLVDKQWIDTVSADIKDVLKGTSLEGIEIIPVSSQTREGIEELTSCLEKLTAKVITKNTNSVFRLPIDRFFTLAGHGTVVTGTAIGGKITKGDIVSILPCKLESKIRGIQVHNQSVESAFAGDRCALNLSGIEKNDLERGDVITHKGLIHPTLLADAVLFTVKGNKGLYHNQRVHVNIGTKEVVARIRIIGNDHIEENGKGYVQLRFEEPVVALRGDRFIVRAYSPVITLGGGKILFHHTNNRRRFSNESIEALKLGYQGHLKEIVNFIIDNSNKILGFDEIWTELYEDRENIQKILSDSLKLGEIYFLKEPQKYLSIKLYNRYINKINLEFDRLFKKNPFKFQIDKEEIKSKIFPDVDPKDYMALLDLLINNGTYVIKKHNLSLPDKRIINQILNRKDTKSVETFLMEQKFNLTTADQLSEFLKIQKSNIERITFFLIEVEHITHLGNGLLIHNNMLYQAVKRIRELINEQGSVTVSQVRDALETGRKTAVALLEYLDEMDITKREENIRRPGVHYMDYLYKSGSN